MRWQYKAKIMKACALLPAGGQLYRFIQKTFGRLKADPMSRISVQVEMARWILEMGGKVEGKTFFEVGTGHCPIVPIGFFLCGAEQVVTVDLHRRLDIGILEKTLVWMAENRDEICGYYDGVIEKAVFYDRMNLIEQLKHNPKKLLSEANIVYLSPADAANIDLPDASVDYHISIMVFEHIPGEDIEWILKEAKRILKKDGIAIHFIDLSDHFQHQDASITRINFLRYSETEWHRIAGNEFAYCNRLRASDYLDMFQQLDFTVVRHEIDVDQDSMSHLQKMDFPLDEKFVSYTPEDICLTSLRILLRNHKK